MNRSPCIALLALGLSFVARGARPLAQPVDATIDWVQTLQAIRGPALSRSDGPSASRFVVREVGEESDLHVEIGGFALGSFSTLDCAQLLVLTREYRSRSLPTIACRAAILHAVATADGLRWTALDQSLEADPLFCAAPAIAPSLADDGAPFRPAAVLLTAWARDADGVLRHATRTIAFDELPYRVVRGTTLSDPADHADEGSGVTWVLARSGEVVSAEWSHGAQERSILENDRRLAERLRTISPGASRFWLPDDQARVLVVPTSDAKAVAASLTEMGIDFSGGDTASPCQTASGEWSSCVVRRYEIPRGALAGRATSASR